MSKSRDLRDYLLDMKDALDSIQEFTAGMTYEEFCSEKKTFYAVVRAFEVLGEAAKQIDESVRQTE